MEKKDNKKTETFLLRLPKEQKEKIFKVVQKSSYNNASELIRAGIEKELNIQINKDNMDFITKELSRLLDIKLDYFIKSQLKINSNNTRVNALNTYILGEVINLLTGDELYQKFLDILEKARQKANYFVKYQLKDKLRKEFTNDIFREDLLPIYQEKDFAKKNITSENYLLQQLKKVSTDENTLKELMQYEKGFEQIKFVRNLLKDKQLKEIVDMLIDLKKDLKETTGSIKYQYLKKYPEIIEKVDSISKLIINSSIQCQREIDKYIKAKQKLLEFQYTNSNKLEKAKEDAKKDAEQEIIKLIGNQILDIERKWLNTKEDYTNIKYTNESINLLDNILTLLYFQAENQKKYNKNFEMKYKKQLSKQAKKEYALRKANTSSFEWEDEM